MSVPFESAAAIVGSDAHTTDQVAAGVLIAMACAVHGFDQADMLGFIDSAADVQYLAEERFTSDADDNYSPEFMSWLSAGRPGYRPADAAVDAVDDSVWDAVEAGGERTATAVIADLSHAGREYWDLASDLCDIWGL